MIKSRVFRRRFPLSRKSHVTPPRRWEPEGTHEGVIIYDDRGYPKSVRILNGIYFTGMEVTLSELERFGARHVARLPNDGGGERLRWWTPRRPVRLSPKLRAALGWMNDLRGGRA